MNTVIVYLIQWVVFAPHNLYAIEINKLNRNCYNCGGFGHMTRYYRNKGIGNRIEEGRRLEYRENKNNGKRRMIEERQNNNLNRDRDLIVLD